MNAEAIIIINGEEIRRVDISDYIETQISVTDERGLGQEIANDIDGTTV